MGLGREDSQIIIDGYGDYYCLGIEMQFKINFGFFEWLLAISKGKEIELLD